MSISIAGYSPFSSLKLYLLKKIKKNKILCVSITNGPKWDQKKNYS